MRVRESVKEVIVPPAWVFLGAGSDETYSAEKEREEGDTTGGSYHGKRSENTLLLLLHSCKHLSLTHFSDRAELGRDGLGAWRPLLTSTDTSPGSKR